MRVLIWIFTFLIGSIVNLAIGNLIGIKAGAVLLYLIDVFIAKNCVKNGMSAASPRQNCLTIPAGLLCPFLPRPVPQVNKRRSSSWQQQKRAKALRQK